MQKDKVCQICQWDPSREELAGVREPPPSYQDPVVMTPGLRGLATLSQVLALPLCQPRIATAMLGKTPARDPAGHSGKRYAHADGPAG